MELGRGTRSACSVRASSPSSNGMLAYKDLTSMVTKVAVDGNGDRLFRCEIRCCVFFRCAGTLTRAFLR